MRALVPLGVAKLFSKQAEEHGHTVVMELLKSWTNLAGLEKPI